MSVVLWILVLVSAGQLAASLLVAAVLLGLVGPERRERRARRAAVTAGVLSTDDVRRRLERDA